MSLEPLDLTKVEEPRVTSNAVTISNHQVQIVTQDNTTINNIFRSEFKDTEDFFKKLFKEILLNLIEPDRFLKNAKAAFIIAITYRIFHDLSIQQITDLIVLVIGHK